METSFYILGVFLAIISGSVNNIGSVLQKKVVNELPTEAKFFRSLIKKPLWLMGLIMQMGIGSIFFMVAQLYIGPALIPGLMAFGLVFLAIGSAKIVKESLKKVEITGIILMISAIFFLGLSELIIDITQIDILQPMVILNMTVFTISLYMGSLICEILQRRSQKYKGILLAIASGFQVSLTNFWIAPMMAFFVAVFTGTASLGEIILFVITSIILVISSMTGIAKIQQSFQVANASRMIPIQQVPIQIMPIFVYFLVFSLIAPSIMSIFFMVIGVFFIIISSFLLAKRQAQLEAMK